jgi:hypothetical protein
MKLVNILTKAQRKGQLTMFMLVGIVVLLIFVFVFFLLNSLAETRMRGKIEKTKAPALTTPIIQFYIRDCLKDVLKEGLIKIGLQGGYFYEGQYGYIYSSGYKLPYTNFNGENVSYLVYPIYNPFEEEVASYNLGWPCRTDENSPSYCRFKRNETHIMYFDFVSDLEEIDATYSDEFSVFRLPTGLKINIQKEIEQYVKDKIPECINFSAVAENFPGYEITFEEPEPHVSLGIKSTSVQLNYPIKLKFQNYEPVTIIQEFQTQLPVRFRKILGIVVELLKTGTRNELNDIDFDPSTEIYQIIEDPAITFSIDKSDDSIFDEVYIINDSLSVLDNKNYIFQFARRNRPPVLNYIGKYPSYLYNPADTSKDIYDYLTIPVSGLDTIVATINATDPDEDTLIVYSSESDTIPELNLPNIIPLSTFTINESHIGYHNITVRAFDGEFTDVQRVRLLVDPILEPKAEGVNIYGGDVYSPEDPFSLNATLSMESLDEFASYIFGWEDFTVIKNIRIGIDENVSYPCIALPSGNECSNAVFNIEDMSGLVLATGGVVLQVNLSYSQISQDESGSIIIKKQDCIPYTSPEGSYPYPYNNADPTTEEAFLGSHTCCNSDGTIKGTNAVCYQKDECVGGHYNLYTRTHYCDGERGNMCGGDNITYEPTDRCGNCGHRHCVTSFGAATNGGVCYGQGGCQYRCYSEIVDRTEDGLGHESNACDCSYDDVVNNKPCKSDTIIGTCKPSYDAWGVPIPPYHCG